jgi:Holliday junction DNA helicase RuvA
MLSFIKGTVYAIKEQSIVIDTGNFGLALQVPDSTVFQVSSPINLHSYLHWNQEQGPSLFGFQTELEKAVFLLVISCSGIGPKIALAVLAGMTPSVFLNVVQTGNDEALSAINGIGQKKAEQLIMQLKHKVTKLLESGIEVDESGNLAQWQDLSKVLVELKYSKAEVAQALKYVQETQQPGGAKFDVLLRSALSYLSKKI